MPTLFSRSVCLCWLLIFSSANATPSGCQDNLYLLFKAYRQKLPVAERFEDLAGYFSQGFNAYYLPRLNHPNDGALYISQYWQNLTQAKDIVITYSQTQHCLPLKATLSITGLLTLHRQRQGDTLDLWRIDIDYVKEASQWKIDAIEYNLASAKQQTAAKSVLDNFTVIE